MRTLHRCFARHDQQQSRRKARHFVQHWAREKSKAMISSERSQRWPILRIASAYPMGWVTRDLREGCVNGLRGWIAVLLERWRWNNWQANRRLKQAKETEKARAIIVDIFRRKQHAVGAKVIRLVVCRNHTAQRQRLMRITRLALNAWFHNRMHVRCPFNAETCKGVYKEKQILAKNFEELKLQRWSIHGLY